MGPDDDPRAVVDENGKVRRLDSLYIGDASIMPDVPSVATNPTVILIAEIVADRIKAAIGSGTPKAKPARVTKDPKNRRATKGTSMTRYPKFSNSSAMVLADTLALL
jgi:choline dehydrogenase-like flavoprotein